MCGVVHSTTFPRLQHRPNGITIRYTFCSRNREHHRLLMKNPPPAWWLREDSLRHALHHVYARGGGEGGGNGGEHGDDDVQDFAPKVLVFHDF